MKAETDDDTKLIRVVRTLEYFGTPRWLVSSLERSIQIGRPLRVGHGYIRTVSLVSEHEATDSYADGAVGTLRPPLIYIAGPFGGESKAAHEYNVGVAADYRAPIAALGCYPVCPHTNTRDLGGNTGKSDDPKEQEFWYLGSLELLRRCDAILMIKNWQLSTGATREKQAAEAWGIPVLHSDHPTEMEQLTAWLKGRQL